MPDLPAEDRDAASLPLPVPAPALSSAERRTLRARAHDLDPVVMVGDAGLSDAVLAETDLALNKHGLIKVRVFGDDREARLAIAAALSARLGCALVQSIGKLLVLWRPGSEPSDAPAARPPARRRTAAVPKKLAALGKPAPKRRARPGVPRPERDEPPPKRRLASKQLRAGPGIRSAKGALDPTVVPRTRGAAPAGVSTERVPRPTTTRSVARSPAVPARGPGSSNRSGIGGPPRKGPGSPSRAGTTAPARSGTGSGSRSGTGSGSRSGTGSTSRSGAGSTSRSGSGRPPRDDAPPARTRTTPGSGVLSRSPAPPSRSQGQGGRKSGVPSAARPPASGSRQGARSATSATDSGRPAPRTRAVRRGR